MTDREFIKLPYVECQAGWKNVLQPIFDYVEQYNKNNKEKIEFLQIKEKFGGLRVYTNFITKELNDLIEKAEEDASETCEYCGTTDDVGTITSGWIKTICKKCVNKLTGSLVWRDSKGKKYYKRDGIDI